jgi:hypothetical protein
MSVPDWPAGLQRPWHSNEGYLRRTKDHNGALAMCSRETVCPHCSTALAVPGTLDPITACCPSCGENLGQRWYREVYLKSPYWKETADFFKLLRGHECEICSVSVGLHVHHNGPTSQGYHDENDRSLLWREQTRPDLMQVLCRNHHRQAHGLPPEAPSTADSCETGVWITREDELREFEQEIGLRPAGEFCDDCDAEYATCPDCDNEMCPACGDGCTCDDDDGYDRDDDDSD